MLYTLQTRCVIGLIAVTLLVSPFVFASSAKAQVTDTDITAQQRVVLSEMVDVLQADVRLLQLRLVQKLQIQVAVLQAQVDARTK